MAMKGQICFPHQAAPAPHRPCAAHPALPATQEMVVEVPPAAMEELAAVSRRLVAQGVTVDT